jgi:hypothetical protein
MGASNSRNPLDLSRPLMGLIKLYFFTWSHLDIRMQDDVAANTDNRSFERLEVWKCSDFWEQP